MSDIPKIINAVDLKKIQEVNIKKINKKNVKYINNLIAETQKKGKRNIIVKEKYMTRELKYHIKDQNYIIDKIYEKISKKIIGCLIIPESKGKCIGYMIRWT